MNDLIRQAEALKAEHDFLANLLLQKKVEIDEASINNAEDARLQELTDELREIICKIDDLSERQKILRSNLNKAFYEQNHTRKSAPVIVSDSIASKTLISKIFENKKNGEIDIKDNIKKADTAKVVKPIKEEISKLKKEVKTDLYSKAASEKAAQEKFLKATQKSTRNYGNI
ncbi:MAG: hypothetical protein FD145_714 [Candidatus Saganbacteria bacterium]|uniref:Uncharacterized protein n=1 Tax=Candidatus Saganbacteria bacterium TaxID=2575572 RepID=A0A833NS33_UNCSA|nr:MAG: hypothetical protein FD145_714 [Candidatus Saganbacteria bacterium]